MSQTFTYRGKIEEIVNPILHQFYTTAESVGFKFNNAGTFYGLATELDINSVSIVDKNTFNINSQEYNVNDYIKAGNFEYILDYPPDISVLKSRDDNFCIVKRHKTEELQIGVLIKKDKNTGSCYYHIPNAEEPASAFGGELLIVSGNKRGIFLANTNITVSEKKGRIIELLGSEITGYYLVDQTMLLRWKIGGAWKDNWFELVELPSGKEMLSLYGIEYNKKDGLLSVSKISASIKELIKFDNSIISKNHVQSVFNKELERLLLLANNGGVLCEKNNSVSVLKSIVDVFKKDTAVSSVVKDGMETFRVFCTHYIGNTKSYLKFKRSGEVKFQYDKYEVIARHSKNEHGAYDFSMTITDPAQESKLEIVVIDIPDISDIKRFDRYTAVLEVKTNGDNTLKLKGRIGRNNGYDLVCNINNFAKLQMDGAKSILEVAQYNSSKDYKMLSKLDIIKYKTPSIPNIAVGNLTIKCWSPVLNELNFVFNVEENIQMLQGNKPAVPTKVDICGSEEELVKNYTKLLLKGTGKTYFGNEDTLSL